MAVGVNNVGHVVYEASGQIIVERYERTDMNTWLGSSEQALVTLLSHHLGQSANETLIADWQAVLTLARQNRAVALVQTTLTDQMDVPESIRQELRQRARKSFVETTASAQALGDIAVALSGISWSLLRGPALGARLYDDLALRPYGDLDVLVTPNDVDRASQALRAIGYSLPATALAEAYYRHYHLHLELIRPGPPITSHLELHWALDHPFTLLTMNAADIVERSQPMSVNNTEIPVPELNDLLLTLAIHFVKHMVQLPTQLRNRQLTDIIRSGFLLQLFDIALLLFKSRTELDWEMLSERATSWRAGASLRLSLEAVEALWPGLTTETQRQRFPLPTTGSATQTLLQIMDRTSPDAFRLKRAVFFRPVRLLDGLSYLFPPGDYLFRRYGSDRLLTRLRHSLSAALQFSWGGFQLMYYLTLKRFWPSQSGTGTLR